MAKAVSIITISLGVRIFIAYKNSFHWQSSHLSAYKQWLRQGANTDKMIIFVRFERNTA